MKPYNISIKHLFISTLPLFLLTGCGQEDAELPPSKSRPLKPLRMKKTEFHEVTGWNYDQLSEALPALRHSCKSFLRRHPEGDFYRHIKYKHWHKPCKNLPSSKVTHEQARKFFEHYFQPYEIFHPEGKGPTITGYVEYTLKGCLKPTAKCKTPLHRKPAGSGPFPERAVIDRGYYNNKGLDLIYVEDPVDKFFLQIQGSGRVVLPDGRIIRIGYEGQNGHKWVPIGKELLRRKWLKPDQMSMQAIRTWLKKNRHLATQVMNWDPSYVFFRILPGNSDGPIGAFGVPLYGLRAIAVDPEFVRLGMPMFVDIGHIKKLVFAHDTGGAIKGPMRGDLFFGHGESQELLAGALKATKGRKFMLLPKE